MYFPFFGHHPYQTTRPHMPKTLLNQEEVDLYLSRWTAYHQGKSPYKPPHPKLPVLNIPAPPPYILPTTDRTPPTHLRWWITTAHPLAVPVDEYDTIVDHILNQQWSDIDIYDPSTQTLLLKTLRTLRTRRINNLISYQELLQYSRNYGHNVVAMLNWLMDEYSRTGTCRFDIATLPNTPWADDILTTFLTISESVDLEWLVMSL